MRHNSAVSGHPKFIRISLVDWLSTGPPGLGRHSSHNVNPNYMTSSVSTT